MRLVSDDWLSRETETIDITRVLVRRRNSNPRLQDLVSDVTLTGHLLRAKFIRLDRTELENFRGIWSLLFVGAPAPATVTVTATAWRVRCAGELAFVLYHHLDVVSGSPPCFLASPGEK